MMPARGSPSPLITGEPAADLPRPAWDTKHIRELRYRLWPSEETVTLLQDDSRGDSTGRTLWLSAQVLSVYLIRRHRARPKAATKTLRAIELGAGTALVSLTLASLGIDVIATDIPSVLESTVVPSISSAGERLGWGSVTPLPLDWSNALAEGPTTPAAEVVRDSEPYDLIATADTVYAPDLNRALIATLATLAETSARSRGGVPPEILLALERRDPLLVDSFLELAQRQFICRRVRNEEVVEALDGLGWEDEDWDGVEIWTLQPREG